MPFKNTDIPGLLIFEPNVYRDERGYFFEAYNEQVFRKQGLDMRFVQDNQSFSYYGVIRGLHYQMDPHAQTKLIRVVEGRVIDVAVDIRKGSPTFGKHLAIEISAENKLQLLIPRGFAHGFSVLSETAQLQYKCDGLYNKESEGGIRYDDPQLDIDWGIPADKVIVSGKDLELPSFAQCRNTFQYAG
ncbi:dTDP-4-dehydrorhamnose 3,5-epimerase [Puia dinghuensis]|uniref:dTDP-4-dehydrorhamnose 3,5-epimerase n=1 Tax=Puia dinghuensis TaxID=1792502 RepID=A0A8J2UDX3_9BACT|nr:dTDP-4-dehydrorhamnose 3,5-epimerase [Puia dinghuensis]GGB04240.1 dTDP-4-dehydrorhamnose 3,5-epimerase [Puia dinghuensis]